MAKTLEPLPYYKWLWRDWRANRRVQRLHYVAKGLYRELLDEQWCEGFIPPDVETLADICGCPLSVMQEHWTSLQDLFETQEDGRLVNRKLEQQRTAEDSIRAAKARGGQKSALAKLNKINKPSRGVEDLLDSSSRPNPESHIAEQSRAETEQSISEQEVDESLTTDGQEESMNLKKLKESLGIVAAANGARLGGYDSTWEEIRLLSSAHGSGAVITDFREWLQETRGDDFPKGALVAYLRTAAERLVGDSAPATQAAKDPEVQHLIREITYASGDKVTFQGRHKVLLADLLKEYADTELLSIFRTFIESKDLEDPYTLKYIAQNFLDAADGLAYSARKKKKESEQYQIARDATARRMQEEAEAERAKRDEERAKEEAAFDPLA